MGSVYKARDTILERLVAFKVLSPTLANDDSFVERFRLEARALARLDHPGIVKVFDADWAENRLFLVMEFVDGGSLADLIKAEGALPPALVVKLLNQVAGGLDYAHQHGLVHRDIKPANILLDKQGDARITDFGLVKESETSLTADGMRLGTPAYMAPEQIQGMEVTPALDVYAIGVVAYEMLTGHPPFTGTMSKVFEGHLLRQPPPLTEVNPSLPIGVQEVMQVVMAKQPEERYPTAQAFVQALEQSIEEEGYDPTMVGEIHAPPESLPLSPASGPQRVSGQVSRPPSGVSAPSGVGVQPPTGTGSGVRPAGAPQKKGVGGFLSGLGIGAAGIVVLGILAVACVCGGIYLISGGLLDTTPTEVAVLPTNTLIQTVFETQPPPTVPPPPATLPPTDLPTAAPTDPPTEVPNQNQEILYQDDFSTQDGGWLSLRDEDGITDYEDGGYRIRVDKANWLFWVNPGLTYNDVSIDVDATKIGGPDINEFGVICRYVDENNFYYMLITSDGFYAVIRYLDDDSELIGMNEYLPTDAVKQGAETNHIRAVCQGDMLSLYANGELVVEVQDGTHTSGDIGLIAGTFDEPGTDILFDNLVVAQP